MRFSSRFLLMGLLDICFFIFFTHNMEFRSLSRLRDSDLNELLGADYQYEFRTCSCPSSFPPNNQPHAHSPLMPGRIGAAVAARSPNRGSRIPRNPVRGADPRFASPAALRPGRPCKPGACPPSAAAQPKAILFVSAPPSRRRLSISSYLLSHLTTQISLSRAPRR